MKKTAVRIIAACLVFAGIVLLVYGADNTADSKNLSEISYSDIQSGGIYYTESLVLVDVFATLSDSNTSYCMAVFVDSSGNTVAASIPVSEDDGIWAQANSYLNDDTMLPGDLILRGYFQAEEGFHTNSTQYSYFSSAVSELEDLFGASVLPIEWQLRYIGSDADDLQVNSSRRTVCTVLGIGAFAGAVFALYLGDIRRPQQKKRR